MFIELAKSHNNNKIKFTAEISTTETTFSDTIVYNGGRFRSENIIDIKTHFKTTETFQYTYFSTCHLTATTRGFVKGEALRLLRTKSSKASFKEKITMLKNALLRRDTQRTL